MRSMTLAPGVPLRKTDCGAVLCDDKGGTFAMNEMGSDILAMALGGFSDKGIAETLKGHFNGSQVASEVAVTEWLADMEAGGLVRSVE